MSSTNVLTGCSVNQLVHYGQCLKYKYFGPMWKSWLQPKPKNFDLSGISTPIQFFYSPTDPHTNKLDLKTLQEHMTYKIEMIEVPQFDHIDFIWGITAGDVVYPKILDFIIQHSKT